MVSNARRPQPHSVATPKRLTTFFAASIRPRVPSSPPVTCDQAEVELGLIVQSELVERSEVLDIVSAFWNGEYGGN